MRGAVLVENQPVHQAGTQVKTDADLRVKKTTGRYVSRAGAKLEAALRAFQVSARGRICWDLGASTGGFTDCLLQEGAARVYAIDVGRGQLHWKLQKDERVIRRDRDQRSPSGLRGHRREAGPHYCRSFIYLAAPGAAGTDPALAGDDRGTGKTSVRSQAVRS